MFVCARVRVCVRACVCACVYKMHNVVLPGLEGDSCSKDVECPEFHSCVNGTCMCPPDTVRVTSTNTHYDKYLGGVVKRRRTKCIPKSGKFPFANLYYSPFARIII